MINYTEYRMISADEENGVTLLQHMASGEYFAYSNEKLYDFADGLRPVGTEGRQLRNNKQEAAKRMLAEAERNPSPVPVAGNSDGNTQKVAELEAKIRQMKADAEKKAPKVSSFAEMLEANFISKLAEAATEEMATKLAKDASARAEEELKSKFGIVPTVHEIKVGDKKPVPMGETLHPQFDIIVRIVEENDPVYLCGPAGTGKSYLAKQVAKVTERDFYYTNSVTDDVQLKGFIDAMGNYHETQFYKAFTNGGLFLMDELDASVPEALVLLNNALANGYFDFPTGRVEAHEDFRCMAAGNTIGRGADSEYTGRYQLDASSMDRFVLIPMDYDKNVELAMCEGDNELVAFAHLFREAAKTSGIPCLLTYRAIQRLHKFESYMSRETALDIAVTKGICEDDIAMLARQINSTNVWAVALKNLGKC